jgi:chromosome segregation ATPase
MIQRVAIYFTIIVFLVLSGCVSKKKYVALESLKDQYLKQSTALQKENETLKNKLESSERDFELMKQDLHYNNAKKDEDLMALNQKVKELENSFSRAQTELSRTRDLYKDQQYYNTQASNEIIRLEFAVEQLKRDTVSLNYSLKMVREKNNELQIKINERLALINEKINDNNQLKTELAGQEGKVLSLEAELALQKSKLDEISEAFIELRKEMLRAKAANTIIDPSVDPNVSKIGKLLEHY